MKKLIKISFYSLLFLINSIFASSPISPKALEKIERAIVNIESRAALTAYGDSGSWTGTGFITDKENGLVITNKHVIGGALIGTYVITFYNGRQMQATPIYYDLWQDYAVLKIEPKEIPDTVEQISFSKDAATQGQNVYIIGSAEGKEFSFHNGYISSLYEITGLMPQASYIVNLNSAGGASGSPLLNAKNEAIGIVYGGSKTYSLALHGEYVKRTLDSLKKGVVPVRKHSGIFCELYSLDKAVKYRNFPKDEMDRYIKDFPNARNKVVAVRAAIPGSPAENIMQPGDIIWKINNIPLGGDLKILDINMDEATESMVNLTIYRNGKKIEQSLKLYDINSNKIERIVDFAGAIFFQADDFISAHFGIPLGSLTIRNVQSGSSFSVIPASYVQDNKDIYRLKVQSMNNQQVINLDELINIIPSLIKQKFISIRFKNYQPYYPNFDIGGFRTVQEELTTDITFDSIDTQPRILNLDPKTKEWISEGIETSLPN